MSASRDAGVAVRAAAARILARVDAEGTFATPLLERAERGIADPRDRALLHEIVLGVLRHRPRIDRAVAAFCRRPIASLEPGVRACLRVGVHGLLLLDRVPPHAAVDAAVSAARHVGHGRAAGLVNAVLRGASRDVERFRVPEASEGDADGLALETGHPRWWTRRWIERLGWGPAAAMLRADNEPAATVVRVRAGHDVDAVRVDLERLGLDVAPARYLGRALRVRAGAVAGAPSFRDGALYVQDEASQMVAMLAGPPGAGPVLDVCAAPGGKAIQLSEIAGSGIPVVALDRSDVRLRRVVENVRRTRAVDVLPACADLAAGPPPVRAASFGVVLVDAPCSGSGTLRRHPEIRWRLRAATVRELAERQSTLLGHAAAAVRGGGRLVYSVCSIEPEEGDDVVARFLEARPDFRRVDPAPLLPPSCRRFVGPDLALRTRPDDGVDGFYAVALDRGAA